MKISLWKKKKRNQKQKMMKLWKKIRDAIFESSQKAFMIKKGNTKDENINKYLIMETVMPIIQRYGIYQDIIMGLSIK